MVFGFASLGRLKFWPGCLVIYSQRHLRISSCFRLIQRYQLKTLKDRLNNKLHHLMISKGNKWRRGYKACLNCRSRKVKCDLGPLDDPHEPPCSRCKREGKVCEFSKPKKRVPDIKNLGLIDVESNDEFQRQRRAIVESITDRKYASSAESSASTGVKWKFDANSMQSALVFLAKAAGSIADEANATTHLDHRRSPRTSKLVGPQSVELPSTLSSGYSDDISNSPLQDFDETCRTAAPLLDKLSSMRPKANIKLTDIEYIGPSKLISENEAVKLIEAFFLTMHPFFPHIPLQLHDPKELVRYPLLLCAIVTISSRYHAFHEIGLEDDGQNRRNIVVHEQLWVHCQKMISQTIWAEASTRSIGTVLAFLLFTEWNPRAIHWNWPDYANQGEMKDSKTDGSDWSRSKNSSGSSSMAAIRRSDRMNWMLTGTAVRLAQDMGLLDISGKISTAAHIAETYTAMNVGQRSTLAESLNEINYSALRNDRKFEAANELTGNEEFYLERILEDDGSKDRWTSFLHEMKDNHSNARAGPLTDTELEFLNDEYVLYYATGDTSNQRHAPEALPFPLKFSRVQLAKIELLRIISIGYESIYSGKERQQLLSNDPRRNLALLHIISPLIESWNKSYHELLKPATGPIDVATGTSNTRLALNLVQMIDGESLICEYYYCQLYIFSLALQVDVRENQLKLSEITRSANYVDIAYNAAKELLASAVRLQQLQLLKCVPVRWIVRIVRSVAFIVKCYMTLLGNTAIKDPLTATILKLTMISTEELLQTIQTAAIVLRDASPDEIHVCTRYSTILMYLCSEIQQKDQERQSRDLQPASHPATPPLRPNTATMSHDCNTADYQETNHIPPIPGDVVDWFTTSDEIGLDFVDSWTEMIEQRYLHTGGDVKEQLLEDFYEQLPTNELHSPNRH